MATLTAEGGTDFERAGRHALNLFSVHIALAYAATSALMVVILASRLQLAQGALLLMGLGIYAVLVIRSAQSTRELSSWVAAGLGVFLAGAFTAAVVPIGGDAALAGQTWMVASPATVLAIRRGLLPALVVLSASSASAAWGVASAGSALRPADYVAPMITTLVCVVVSTLLRRGYQLSSKVVSKLDEAMRQEKLAREVWKSQRRNFRILHDTVLSALAMVANGMATTRPTLVLETCRDALRVLDGDLATAHMQQRPDVVIHEGTLAQRLTESSRLSGLQVKVYTTGGGPEPDDHTINTLCQAARECLVNVEKHAGVDYATLVCHQTESFVQVLIVDEGYGFAPERVPVDRLGLAQSVCGRLADIGGSATVWSRPDYGTTVELRIPSSRQWR